MAFIQGCYYDNKDILNPGGIKCDTSIITFSGSIKPILTGYCIGCHSGPNAPSAVTLDTYTGVVTQASNGNLLSTITHSPGHSPMPKNQDKLSECDIAKIRNWVVAGAPNN